MVRLHTLVHHNKYYTTKQTHTKHTIILYNTIMAS